MYRWIFSLLTISMVFFSTMSFADGAPIRLNKVSLQFQAQQWVSTKTAKVIVGVNATAANKTISALRERILKQLSKLDVAQKWHVINFNRSEDQSGLIRLRMQLSARIPNDQLAKLMQQLKSFTQAGRQYRILAVDFAPGFQTIERAKANLRQKIYQKIKQEMVKLNQIYSKQHFFVYRIRFLTLTPIAATMTSFRTPQTLVKSRLSVSNRMQLGAQVVLASMIKTD